MTIMRRIDRLVYRTILVAGILAGLAAYSNHTTYPCGPDQVGAVGMCVTVPFGGAA